MKTDVHVSDAVTLKHYDLGTKTGSGQTEARKGRFAKTGLGQRREKHSLPRQAVLGTDRR
jgi:hypothetical protein